MVRSAAFVGRKRILNVWRKTGDRGCGALRGMGGEWACIKRFVDDIVKSARAAVWMQTRGRLRV